MLKKRQIFDVTATDFILTAVVSAKGSSTVTCGKTLNLVSSKAEFSVVSIAKRSVIVLSVSFVNHRLNAKVPSFDY